MALLVTKEHPRNSGLLHAVDTEAGPALERLDCAHADVAWKLLEGEADIALAPPLLFAQREGDLALLEGACVAATGATREILLQFNSGLRNIRTVGHYGEAGLETMLAELVMKEKYGMNPRFIPMKRDPAAALAAVDALLYTTDQPQVPEEGAAVLDVIDEWFDMTQLPFVREVFVAWEARMDVALADSVRRAGDAMDAEALRAVDEQLRGRGTEFNTESLPAHYRFRFTPDVQEGLQTFFHMSFYHGLHRDIPNFTFWTPEAGEE